MRSRHQLFSILTLALVLFAQSVLYAQTSPSSQSTSSATTNSAKSSTPKPTCTNNGTYVNSKGQTVRRQRTVRGRLKARPHNVEMEPTVSAGAGAGRARVTAALRNGCEGAGMSIGKRKKSMRRAGELGFSAGLDLTPWTVTGFFAESGC